MLALLFSLRSFLVVSLTFLGGLAWYRLFLHPLAKVPGPRLAALSRIYEFYYDCLVGGGGQFTFKIQKLHKRYGPCVRIGPNEVIVDGQTSPSWYDYLYNYNNKIDKHGWFYYPYGSGESFFSTEPADLHKLRRGAVSNYFSMSNTRAYEQLVLNNISNLCNRLNECREKGEVVNMSDAYRCLSTDIVTSFAIPQTDKMLSTPDFGKDFHQIIRNYGMLALWERHLRFVFPLMMAIPDWIMEKTNGGVQLVRYFRNFEIQTQIALRRKGQPPEGERMSILDAIVTSPELDESAKTAKRLIGEARTIVSAGTETLGSTMTTLTYYIVSESSYRDKLAQELAAAPRDSTGLIRLRTLEKLPFLQACISEALRISCLVSSRKPRLNSREAMIYKAPSGEIYTFPPGTILSMNMWDLHFNPAVFPEPFAFKPERWLSPTAEMLQYFVPFGKGSRSCIGMELAKMELSMTVGNLFNQFQFELFDTTEYDVRIAHDYFVPAAPSDSKGVRVRIR